TIRNSVPPYCSLFRFGPLVITAGIAAPLTIIAAIIAIALLGNTLSQFSRAHPSTGGFITFVGKTFGGTSAVTTALLAGAGYIVAISSVLVIAGGFFQILLQYYFNVSIPWIIFSVLFTGGAMVMMFRGVAVSTGLMAVTYLLLAYSTVTGFNYNGKALASSEIPFISVAHDVAGWLAFFAYMAGMTSTLGVLIAAVNSQCRLIFNAGREGLVPRWIGRVHPTRRTPVNAIITFVALASVIVAIWALGHVIGGHTDSLN